MIERLVDSEPTTNNREVYYEMWDREHNDLYNNDIQ